MQLGLFDLTRKELKPLKKQRKIEIHKTTRKVAVYRCADAILPANISCTAATLRVVIGFKSLRRNACVACNLYLA